MAAPKRAQKRKESSKSMKKVIEVTQNEEESDSEEAVDSGTEDFLASELNDGDDDSSDEETGEVDKIPDSDTEQDQVVFESDDDVSQLESGNDSNSEDDDEINNSEFESDSEEESVDEDEDDDDDDNDDNDDNEVEEEESDNEEVSELEFESDSDDLNIANKSETILKDEKNSIKDKRIIKHIQATNSKGKEKSTIVKNKELTSTKTEGKESNLLKKKNKELKNSKIKSKDVEKVSNKLEITEIDDNSKNENQSNQDEYEFDSSDEEDIRNTVGNIPMKWYDDYKHIGYNWEGKKILKPEKGDQLDNFLKRMEDPDFWRTIKDPQTGQDVVLSEADIQLITRIQKQKVPDTQFDEYSPWVEWFTSEVMKTPLRKFPEHKRSFVPSKIEAKKVSKLVHALKMGWIKSSAEMEKERQQAKNDPQFYMLWQTDDQAEEMRRIHKHIQAPKRFLPGHAESYNPPAEYLFDAKEMKAFNKYKNTPWKRKLHFIPQKYESLRNVPAYSKYIKERFQRCLDLYLCPRAIKMKLTIQPEDLVPQLPSPKDLQPFPTTMSMIFKGHTDMVRSISSEWKGQYFASGGDDMTLRIWEIATGRCVKVVPCGGVVRSVAWCPNQAISLIAVAADRKVLLINPEVGDHVITKKTDQLLEIIPQSDAIVADNIKSTVQWEQAEGEEKKNGIRLILNHFKMVKQVTWHGKGDYFASVMPEGQNRSVLINQLSKRRSQLPFRRPKGLIQCVLFHPIRPFLFVATQRNVRIYDLVKQEMVKKLLSNSQWISSMAIHPGGDNLLIGTYDRKVVWFDLDLSTKPYQTLRLHGTGIRNVAFHKRYPLFASGADDRGLIVSHGMVYNDLLKNPLIVPLKRLSNHESFNDFGILDVMFHPIQPWVFSAGADSTIRMYT
ncbi:ribosome biogenesis protein BOP1 homolog isoform X2 [Leptopilina heterotoma]|uniref:ribosome biogenesis protein BOP1 homolog isoform X2 n=1 Tax=Leptopilina heterotoma TaxID=63436 RepID=UPI001CA871CD|nr:ribosome biogenesis protein BOP1 homolog isoform X2 [Leptopilina heterotoma]